MKLNKNNLLKYGITLAITIAVIILYLIMDSMKMYTGDSDFLIIFAMIGLIVLTLEIAFDYKYGNDRKIPDNFGEEIKQEEKDTKIGWMGTIIASVITGSVIIMQIAEPGTFSDIIYALSICIFSITAIFAMALPASLTRIKKIKQNKLFPLLAEQKIAKDNIRIIFTDEAIVDFLGIIKEINYNDIVSAEIKEEIRVQKVRRVRISAKFIYISIIKKDSLELKIAATRTNLDNKRHLEIIEELQKRVPNLEVKSF